MTSVRLVWPTQAQLGEGPMWSRNSGTLFYVDIKGGALHRYHPATETHETVAVDAQPSFIVPAEGGRMLVGSGNGLFFVAADGLGERLATIDMPGRNRTNDATVDRDGRLWFGTMDDDQAQSTGAVYCWTEGAARRMGGDAIVTNGPAVSSDGRSLYHVNSVDRTIWRYSVEAGPALGDPQLFIRLAEVEGYPDGVVLDSEGCLWVALWDGWGVQRYAPDGELLTRIDLPCQRVTKIAFGGDDLRTAFVTTARIGLSDAELAEQPLAGGLFAFESPVAGLPLPEVRL